MLLRIVDFLNTRGEPVPTLPSMYSSKDNSYTEAKGKVGFRRFVGKPYIEPLHLNEKCITNQEEDL